MLECSVTSQRKRFMELRTHINSEVINCTIILSVGAVWIVQVGEDPATRYALLCSQFLWRTFPWGCCWCVATASKIQWEQCSWLFIQVGGRIPYLQLASSNHCLPFGRACYLSTLSPEKLQRKQVPVRLDRGVMFSYWDEDDKHNQIPSTNRRSHREI